MEEKRYKLRLKAIDKTFYSDKKPRLEHKGIVALARNCLPLDTGFTAAELAEFSYESEETISGYLRELDKSRYIEQIPYTDEDRI